MTGLFLTIELDLHCPHAGIQTTLLTSSGIFVYQALARHLVENGGRFTVGSFSLALIARLDRLDRLLYISAHHRTLRGVLLTALLRLAGALCSLS